MAISDVAAYAHLTAADIEALGDELDLIRRDVEDSLGARDAAYIRRVITFQRVLDAAARLIIFGTRSTAGWDMMGALRTIYKLALPDRFLTATSDDAPETASERRFDNIRTTG